LHAKAAAPKRRQARRRCHRLELRLGKPVHRVTHIAPSATTSEHQQAKAAETATSPGTADAQSALVVTERLNVRRRRGSRICTGPRVACDRRFVYVLRSTTDATHYYVGSTSSTAERPSRTMQAYVRMSAHEEVPAVGIARAD